MNVSKLSKMNFQLCKNYWYPKELTLYLPLKATIVPVASSKIGTSFELVTQIHQDFYWPFSCTIMTSANSTSPHFDGTIPVE